MPLDVTLKPAMVTAGRDVLQERRKGQDRRRARGFRSRNGARKQPENRQKQHSAAPGGFPAAMHRENRIKALGIDCRVEPALEIGKRCLRDTVGHRLGQGAETTRQQVSQVLGLSSRQAFSLSRPRSTNRGQSRTGFHPVPISGLLPFRPCKRLLPCLGLWLASACSCLIGIGQGQPDAMAITDHAVTSPSQASADFGCGHFRACCRQRPQLNFLVFRS